MKKITVCVNLDWFVELEGESLVSFQGNGGVLFVANEVPVAEDRQIVAMFASWIYWKEGAA